MTVADLRRRMPNSEFYQWVWYFENRAKQAEVARQKAEADARRPVRRR